MTPENQNKKFARMYQRFQTGETGDIKSAIKNFDKKQLCALIMWCEDYRPKGFKQFILTEIF